MIQTLSATVSNIGNSLMDKIQTFTAGGIQMLDEDDWRAKEGSDEALDGALKEMSAELTNLIGMIWPWVLGILGAVIVVWGAYIGIKVAIAHRNEDQVNARAMIKNLIIGVVIIAVIGFGGPILIEALVVWLS